MNKLNFDNRIGRKLTKTEKSLLNEIFTEKYQEIKIYKNILKGKSNTNIYEIIGITKYKMNSRSMIFKFGNKKEIKEEKENYIKYVRDFLGSAAPPLIEYAETDRKAAIIFSWAGNMDSEINTESLSEICKKDFRKFRIYFDGVIKTMLKWYEQTHEKKIHFKVFAKQIYNRALFKELQEKASKELEQNIIKKVNKNLKKYINEHDENIYLPYAHIHGDLNCRNIICEISSDKNNFYLIDFRHAKYFCIFQDFAKLEADIFFEVYSKKQSDMEKIFCNKIYKVINENFIKQVSEQHILR